MINYFFIILRLREGSKKGKSFLSNLGKGFLSNQAEKDDKTLIESAVKQLRQIISQNTSN